MLQRRESVPLWGHTRTTLEGLKRKDGRKNGFFTVRNGMFETQAPHGRQWCAPALSHGAGALVGWEPFFGRTRPTLYCLRSPAHPGFETSTGIDQIDDIIDMVVYYTRPARCLHLESVHVVGHSLGGMIGAELAALSPHRVANSCWPTAVGLWRDDHPIADFFAMTPDQLAIALVAPIPIQLWRGDNGGTTRRKSPTGSVPHPHAAPRYAGNILWPIPDKA